jgi:hypothetical protein
VVSNKEENLGHILFNAPYTALHSLLFQAATAAAATATTFYVFASTGHCCGAPSDGLPVYSTPNAAPVLVFYGLLLRHSMGSGTIRLKRTFRVVLVGSCNHDASELLSYRTTRRRNLRSLQQFPRGHCRRHMQLLKIASG